MPRTTARIALRALLPLLVVPAVAVPTAAHAEHWSAPDASGDVVTWTFDPDAQACGPAGSVPAPDATVPDITRLGVAHTRRAVVVTVRLRDLDGSDRPGTIVDLRTPRWDFVASAFRYDSPGWPPVRSESTLGRMQHRDGPTLTDCMAGPSQERDVECDGLHATFPAHADVVRLRIPRSCLGEPRWVRVAAFAFDMGATAAGIDLDAWAPGAAAADLREPYGPRVRAGAR